MLRKISSCRDLRLMKKICFLVQRTCSCHRDGFLALEKPPTQVCFVLFLKRGMRWFSKTLCWAKEARHKRVYLYEIVEDSKLNYSDKRQTSGSLGQGLGKNWVQRGWGGEDVLWEWKCSVSWLAVVTQKYIFVKAHQTICLFYM